MMNYAIEMPGKENASICESDNNSGFGNGRNDRRNPFDNVGCWICVILWKVAILVLLEKML